MLSSIILYCQFSTIKSRNCPQGQSLYVKSKSTFIQRLSDKVTYWRAKKRKTNNMIFLYCMQTEELNNSLFDLLSILLLESLFSSFFPPVRRKVPHLTHTLTMRSAHAHHIIPWVTRPERLKGSRTKSSRPEGPPTGSWGPTDMIFVKSFTQAFFHDPEIYPKNGRKSLRFQSHNMTILAFLFFKLKIYPIICIYMLIFLLLYHCL